MEIAISCAAIIEEAVGLAIEKVQLTVHSRPEASITKTFGRLHWDQFILRA